MSFHKSCFGQKVREVKTIDQAREFNKKETAKMYSHQPKIQKLREKIKELEMKIQAIEVKADTDRPRFARSIPFPKIVGKPNIDDVINSIEKVGRDWDSDQWVYFVNGKWYDIQQLCVDPSDDNSSYMTMTDIKTGIMTDKIT